MTHQTIDPRSNQKSDGSLEARRRALVAAGISGLVIGGLWALQSGESLWEHAVRFGILLFVVAPFLTWRLSRTKAAGAVKRLRIGRLIVAKGALLLGALAATAALRPLTGAADYIVAVAMFLTVTYVGPRLVPWLAPAD